MINWQFIRRLYGRVKMLKIKAEYEAQQKERHEIADVRE